MIDKPVLRFSNEKEQSHYFMDYVTRFKTKQKKGDGNVINFFDIIILGNISHTS